MRRNIKNKILLSVLALGISYGMQAAEAALPDNVLVKDSIDSSVRFYADRGYDNIITAFYYDSAYSKKSDPKNGVDNRFTMNGSVVDNVYAAYTTSGSTNNNNAYLTDGEIFNWAAGAYSATGLQQNNYVSATNTTVGEILAGAIGGGKLIKNSVGVIGVFVHDVAGAYATGKGAANENKATINSGDVTFFAGAISDKGSVNNNIAIVNGGLARYAYGGLSWGKAAVSNNKLEIIGGEAYEACGGQSCGGAVNYNSVLVSGGKFESLYGGLTAGNGSATGNYVAIHNDSKPITITRDIYGAKVEDGFAKNNTVLIEVDCGSIQNVYGAYSDGGRVTGNDVEIANNNMNNVYGGLTGEQGTAIGNSVTVNSGNVTGSVIAGKTQSGAAKNNKLEYLNSKGVVLIGADSYKGGLVSGNTVNVLGSECVKVQGAVTVAYGKAISNKVDINDSQTNGVVGADTVDGSASKNSVILRGKSIISDYAYGGRADGKGNSTGNSITIEGSSYVENIAVAGFSDSGVVSKNVINVTTKNDCDDAEYVGGKSVSGKVTSNKASYMGTNAWTLFGGNSQTGVVSSNTATLEGGQVATVAGGYSWRGKANSNKAIVNDGKAKFVVGGYSGNSENAAAANYNTVTINGGTFESFDVEDYLERLEGHPGIYGGYAYKGTGVVATKNIVNFNAGKAGEIYGAKAEEGNVTSNKVNINSDSAFACYYNNSTQYVYGAFTGKGNAVSNTVKIVAGSAVNLAGGWSNEGNATSNQVILNGTAKVADKADGNIYGGYAAGTSSDSGNVVGTASKNSVSMNTVQAAQATVYGGVGYTSAASNKVTIKDSVVKTVYGAMSLDNASKNTVTINGASNVKGDVYGGYAFNIASNNTVTVTGDSKVEGSIIGANKEGNANKVTLGLNAVAGKVIVCDANGNSNSLTMSGSATVKKDVTVCNGAGNNNKLTMSGNSHVVGNVVVCKDGGVGNSITMSGNAKVDGKISGYEKQKGVPKDKLAVVGGGSLVLDGWSGSIGAVEGLESISFKNITAKAGTSMMVLAKGEASDLSGTTITVGNTMLGSAIKGVSVMSAEDGKLDVSSAKLEDGSAQTVGTRGLMMLSAADNGINGDYVAGGVNPQTKALAESRTAAAAFVNQGTEIVEHGIGQVAAGGNGAKTFAALFGNASRYNTGSHVKVNGWSGIVGVGNTVNNGKLTYGAFFENGTGNYRTFASAMGMPIRGYGEATYNGGGLLVKNKSSKGLYVEGAVRAGRLQNKLNDAVLGGNGLKGYDVSTSYYGAHIGVGKEIKLSEHTALDLYAKYLYTHHGSKSYRIDGDEFRFDSLNSQRTRLGFRINSKINEKAKLYYGLVWDYELDGKADNKVQGYSLHTPSLKGSTVFLDLGAEYKLNDKWSLDINAKGYAGERRGVTGSAQVSYSF